MKLKIYSVKLTTLEPFRIGAQKDVMSSIANPIARIGGRPVVQGPTLKGALRGAIENYLIENFKGNDQLKPCIPSDTKTLSADERNLIREGLYRSDGACRYRGDQSADKKPLCPVCYFLGAMGLPGFVRVPTLFSNNQPEALYSVRMERASETAAMRTNRNYQVMPDNADFVGDIEILAEDPARIWYFGKKRNKLQYDVDKWLDEKDLNNVSFSKKNKDDLIQEFIINRLESINLIGGFKSKGCGRVKIECSVVE